MPLPFVTLSAHPRFRLRRSPAAMPFFGLTSLTFLMITTPALAQTPSASVNPVNLLQHALEWIDGLGILGAIVFIAIYALATVVLFPGSILTLGAGILFGIVWGSIYVFAGACIGATLAFLIGRYGARNWIAQKVESNTKFAAIDQAIGREGFKIVLLTRLSPAFPFTVLNYALGLTRVSLKDYVMGFIGMVPGTVMYVYAGSLLGDLATLGSDNSSLPPTVRWTLNLVGFAATVAVTLYVTQIARRALDMQVNTATRVEDAEHEART